MANRRIKNAGAGTFLEQWEGFFQGQAVESGSNQQFLSKKQKKRRNTPHEYSSLGVLTQYTNHVEINLPRILMIANTIS